MNDQISNFFLYKIHAQSQSYIRRYQFLW